MVANRCINFQSLGCINLHPLLTRSLRGAVDHLGEAEAMGILDHVLVQEVLSKVRLASGDLQDEELAARLKEWSERAECAELVICRERIELWLQSLQFGRDVFQA